MQSRVPRGPGKFHVVVLVKYAKPTQLWNVWLLKLSNQNHATYLMAKSVGANGFSYFLFLFFARENEILIYFDFSSS